jgi:hypothetical protein
MEPCIRTSKYIDAKHASQHAYIARIAACIHCTYRSMHTLHACMHAKRPGIQACQVPNSGPCACIHLCAQTSWCLRVSTPALHARTRTLACMRPPPNHRGLRGTKRETEVPRDTPVAVHRIHNPRRCVRTSEVP